MTLLNERIKEMAAQGSTHKDIADALANDFLAESPEYVRRHYAKTPDTPERNMLFFRSRINRIL